MLVEVYLTVQAIFEFTIMNACSSDIPTRAIFSSESELLTKGWKKRSSELQVWAGGLDDSTACLLQWRHTQSSNCCSMWGQKLPGLTWNVNSKCKCMYVSSKCVSFTFRAQSCMYPKSGRPNLQRMWTFRRAFFYIYTGNFYTCTSLKIRDRVELEMKSVFVPS